MWEFSREGMGIRFGKSKGIEMNMSSNENWNGNGNRYTGMEGNGLGINKTIPPHF